MRQAILAVALILTIAMSIYSQFDDTSSEIIDVVHPVRKPMQVQAKLGPEKNSEPSSKSYRSIWPISTNEVNLFPINAGKKQDDSFKLNMPVVEPIVLPPPEPTAPPLPFIYVGKLVDGAVITIFVSKNGRNFTLKGGEIIESVYEVKSIDSQRVVFEYIPLKLEQILLVWG